VLQSSPLSWRGVGGEAGPPPLGEVKRGFYVGNAGNVGFFLSVLGPYSKNVVSLHLLKEKEMNKALIPEDNSIESIKTRERIIRNFYREWKEQNPTQRKYNVALKDYINIRMVSIVETSEHAAKTYLSTIAVLQLDAILMGAKKGFH